MLRLYHQNPNTESATSTQPCLVDQAAGLGGFCHTEPRALLPAPLGRRLAAAEERGQRFAFCVCAHSLWTQRGGTERLCVGTAKCLQHVVQPSWVPSSALRLPACCTALLTRGEGKRRAGAGGGARPRCSEVTCSAVRGPGTGVDSPPGSQQASKHKAPAGARPRVLPELRSTPRRDVTLGLPAAWAGMSWL